MVSQEPAYAWRLESVRMGVPCLVYKSSWLREHVHLCLSAAFGSFCVLMHQATFCNPPQSMPTFGSIMFPYRLHCPG